MGPTFLLRLFFITVLSISVYAHPSFDWNIKLSLTMVDYDLDVESSVTIKPKSVIRLGNKANASVEAGVKIGHKNKISLFNVFSNIVLNRYVDEIDPNIDNTDEQNKNKKITKLRYQLNTSLRYSLLSSELSLKILPHYHCDKTSYLKTLLLYNFLVRHYKRDTKGQWYFVGYETKDGDRSFEDFKERSRHPKAIKDLKALVNSKIGNMSSFTKLEQGVALVMAEFSNKELKDYWTKFFGSMTEGFYEALNAE